MDGIKSPGVSSEEASSLSQNKTENSTPMPSVSIPTHDTTRAKYQMKELETFAKRLEEAATRAFPSRGRSRYQQVIAVLIQWEENGVNVQPEINRLQTVLDSYGFSTETWVIPSTSSHLKVMEMAKNLVADFGSAENLLIVYYTGHVSIDSSGESTWLCNQDPLSPSVSRSAPGIVRGVNETISACGSETLSTGLDMHLFTNALIDVLDNWSSRVSFSAAMLHSEILAAIKPNWLQKGNWTDKQIAKTGRMPTYMIASGGPHSSSIELARRRGYDNPNRANANFSQPIPSPNPSQTRIFSKLDAYNPANLNKTLESGELLIPHVLVSVALEEDHTLEVEEWYAWVKGMPALSAYAMVEGIYKSYSTMLLISIPLLIWDLLPDDPAVFFIAYVLSNNLLTANSVERFQRLADTKQVIKTQDSKQLPDKTVQFAPLHIEINTPFKVEPPPLSAVKSHPMPIADLPEMADVKRHSMSKVDPPQLVDSKPQTLSTVGRLGLSLDHQLPQELSNRNPPKDQEVKLSAETKTYHQKRPASSSVPESKLQSQATATPDTILAKTDLPKLTLEKTATEKPIKELIQSAQLAREEASRAWDELGRREKRDRARHSALKAGKSVYIDGIKVSPIEQRHHKSKAEAVLGTLIPPMNSTPVPRRGSGEEKRVPTTPPPAPQQGRKSLEEIRALIFDVEVRSGSGEEKNSTTRNELSFVNHKAKKLSTPIPPQPSLAINTPPKKILTPLPLSPPLLSPSPDPEVLKHMLSFQSKISSAGPSPPMTPEQRKEDQWTFLDDEEDEDEDEVVTASEVKRKGSKLVKKKRENQSRGRRGERREAAAPWW
ncbi:hypothetical protein LSUB1_G008562 [Lachnellula subtilissima]|uniref:Uncharacterized protein n=1 Tax=Lachnellula subtilissima TaxID=602034 RepID=A0A8H8RD12_9HELO|nr:hypothetical protein LSUB1_G008562 [Lachnellula subtilissima]